MLDSRIAEQWSKWTRRTPVNDGDAEFGRLGGRVKDLEINLVFILVVADRKSGKIPGIRKSEVGVAQPVKVGFIRESVELSFAFKLNEQIYGFWFVLVHVAALAKWDPSNVRDVFIGSSGHDWLRSPLPATRKTRYHSAIGGVLDLQRRLHRECRMPADERRLGHGDSCSPEVSWALGTRELWAMDHETRRGDVVPGRIGGY
jgi:hypothetical protein